VLYPLSYEGAPESVAAISALLPKVRSGARVADWVRAGAGRSPRRPKPAGRRDAFIARGLIVRDNALALWYSASVEEGTNGRQGSPGG
jgi:hypothetical protein